MPLQNRRGLFVFIIVMLSTLQYGHALRCWSCSSDLDITCMDHFNTTKIQQQRSYYQNVNNNNNPYQRNDMPNLVECSNNLGDLYNTKPVCMKKIITVPNGRQIVMRECKAVSRQQEMGTCPTEPTGRGTTVDFCAYCETDGCNGSSDLTFNIILAIILPISLLAYIKL